MKKILSFLTICVVALSISLPANAQVKFGVKGGLNLTNLSGDVVADIKDALSTYTGFNVGVALHVGLPFGFAIQPEVLYTQSGSKIKMLPEGGFFHDLLEDINTRFVVGNIQIPVGIQWGIEVGPVRPFVQAVPYISFPISHVYKIDVGGEISKKELANDLFSSFDYGIGLGAGVDIWKLQASLKYNWALGSFVKVNEQNTQEIIDQLGVDLKGTKLSGLEISVAFFF